MMGEGAGSDRDPDDIAWRWHDNLIYGLRFEIGNVDEQDWRSDLIFDIDYIAEWVCERAGEVRFRVAPATLTFHQAGDLSLQIDHGDSGGRNALIEWSIDRVDREGLDRPFDYWRWTIHLSTPAMSKIVFCADAFTQTLRSEPRLVSEQRLPRGERGG